MMSHVINLKLVCWYKVDICDANCDPESVGFDCLKVFVKFHFYK